MSIDFQLSVNIFLSQMQQIFLVLPVTSFDELIMHFMILSTLTVNFCLFSC